VSSLLNELYKETKATDNLPEFLAYRIFYWILYNKSVDLVKQIRNLTPELKQHAWITHAWRVHNALELSDYVTFFRLYEETANLGKCILKPIRERIRHRAFRVILRSYKPSVPAAFLQRSLGFKETAGDDLDNMLNASSTQEDDDDEDWEGFSTKCCIVSSAEDRWTVDIKATADALAEHERRVAAQQED